VTGFSVLLAASLLTRIPSRAAAAARKMLGRQVAVALHHLEGAVPERVAGDDSSDGSTRHRG